MAGPARRQSRSDSDEDEIIFQGRGNDISRKHTPDIFSKLSKQLDAAAPHPRHNDIADILQPPTAAIVVPQTMQNAQSNIVESAILSKPTAEENDLFIIDPPISASSRVVPFAHATDPAPVDTPNDKHGTGWEDSTTMYVSMSEQEVADATLAKALAQEQEVWTSDLGSQLDGEADDSNELTESIDGEDVDDDISDDDEDDSIDIDDMLEMLEGTQDEKDAQLAQMLQWQERQGILDIGSSFGDFMPTPKSRRGNEAFISLKPEKSKGSRKNRGKDRFPSASALADAIEQDPYGGFDVMEFERPSLRSKRAKKLGLDGVEPELANEITTMWEKDRQKKAQRKEERQELRAQGLLGRKSQKKAFRGGNARDITIIEIRESFQDFIEGDEDSYLMPPASDYSRKIIHQISHEFGIKSISSGKGSDRRVNLIRTRRTQDFDHDVIDMFEGHFMTATKAGAGKPSKGKPSKKRHSTGAPKGRKSLPGRAGGGGGNSAIGYREGEVVGAAAPEIGLENRGRGMLERMGWSAGMTLGTSGQGILQPIAHVVKNSKAGLG